MVRSINERTFTLVNSILSWRLFNIFGDGSTNVNIKEKKNEHPTRLGGVFV